MGSFTSIQIAYSLLHNFPTNRLSSPERPYGSKWDYQHGTSRHLLAERSPAIWFDDTHGSESRLPDGGPDDCPRCRENAD